jgi:hypothetical protein
MRQSSTGVSNPAGTHPSSSNRSSRVSQDLHNVEVGGRSDDQHFEEPAIRIRNMQSSANRANSDIMGGSKDLHHVVVCGIEEGQPSDQPGGPSQIQNKHAPSSADFQIEIGSPKVLQDLHHPEVGRIQEHRSSDAARTKSVQDKCEGLQGERLNQVGRSSDTAETESDKDKSEGLQTIRPSPDWEPLRHKYTGEWPAGFMELERQESAAFLMQRNISTSLAAATSHSWDNYDRDSAVEAGNVFSQPINRQASQFAGGYDLADAQNAFTAESDAAEENTAQVIENVADAQAEAAMTAATSASNDQTTQIQMFAPNFSDAGAVAGRWTLASTSTEYSSRDSVKMHVSDDYNVQQPEARSGSMSMTPATENVQAVHTTDDDITFVVTDEAQASRAIDDDIIFAVTDALDLEDLPADMNPKGPALETFTFASHSPIMPAPKNHVSISLLQHVRRISSRRSTSLGKAPTSVICAQSIETLHSDHANTGTGRAYSTSDDTMSSAVSGRQLGVTPAGSADVADGYFKDEELVDKKIDQRASGVPKSPPLPEPKLLITELKVDSCENSSLEGAVPEMVFSPLGAWLGDPGAARQLPPLKVPHSRFWAAERPASARSRGDADAGKTVSQAAGYASFDQQAEDPDSMGCQPLALDDVRDLGQSHTETGEVLDAGLKSQSVGYYNHKQDHSQDSAAKDVDENSLPDSTADIIEVLIIGTAQHAQQIADETPGQGLARFSKGPNEADERQGVSLEEFDSIPLTPSSADLEEMKEKWPIDLGQDTGPQPVHAIDSHASLLSGADDSVSPNAYLADMAVELGEDHSADQQMQSQQGSLQSSAENASHTAQKEAQAVQQGQVQEKSQLDARDKPNESEDRNADVSLAAVDEEAMQRAEDAETVVIIKAARPFTPSRLRESISSLSAPKDGRISPAMRIPSLPKSLPTSLGRLVRSSSSAGSNLLGKSTAKSGAVASDAAAAPLLQPLGVSETLMRPKTPRDLLRGPKAAASFLLTYLQDVTLTDYTSSDTGDDERSIALSQGIKNSHKMTEYNTLDTEDEESSIAPAQDSNSRHTACFGDRFVPLVHDDYDDAYPAAQSAHVGTPARGVAATTVADAGAHVSRVGFPMQKAQKETKTFPLIFHYCSCMASLRHEVAHAICCQYINAQWRRFPWSSHALL